MIQDDFGPVLSCYKPYPAHLVNETLRGFMQVHLREATIRGMFGAGGCAISLYWYKEWVRGLTVPPFHDSHQAVGLKSFAQSGVFRRKNHCKPDTFCQDFWQTGVHLPARHQEVLLSSEFSASSELNDNTWEEALKLRHLLALAAKPDFIPPSCFQQAPGEPGEVGGSLASWLPSSRAVWTSREEGSRRAGQFWGCGAFLVRFEVRFEACFGFETRPGVSPPLRNRRPLIRGMVFSL